MSLKLALGWTLFGSILINIALVGWSIWKARGIKRFLFIYTGGGFIPIPLKFGQRNVVWTRPDKSSVAFTLTDEWSMAFGWLGRCWIGNGQTGQFMKWVANEKRWLAVTPQTAGNDEAIRALGADPVKNLVDGALMRIDFDHEPVFPDGNWHASAIQDTRERKWFDEQRGGIGAGKAVPWVVVGIMLIAALFILPKVMGGG
jgi:hypothetical protein